MYQQLESVVAGYLRGRRGRALHLACSICWSKVGAGLCVLDSKVSYWKACWQLVYQTNIRKFAGGAKGGTAFKGNARSQRAACCHPDFARNGRGCCGK